MKRTLELDAPDECKRTGNDFKLKTIKSPIRLTKIRDLPDSENLDTLSLDEILGDPSLGKMWQFNFMMSIPFVMQHIHKRCRSHIMSYFVHGYKISTMEEKQRLRHDADMCEHPENITVEGVRLNTPYATHHSKMMVLVFGEGDTQTLQIVIHTANLIPFDWANMTQGVWLSPRLNKWSTTVKMDNKTLHEKCQFEHDFLHYIDAYNIPSTKKLHSLIQEFDLSPIKAVFVASVPGNYFVQDLNYKQWGIARLQHELSKLEIQYKSDHQVVCQVSSIGSLGVTDSYMKQVIEDALNGYQFFTNDIGNRVPLRIVFPTVDEVSDSLNGYASGGSIHFKRSSEAQVKQLLYLEPRLCRWEAYKAGRARASAHIKTYFRTSHDNQRLEWFLLTSANLSKQAWGTINQKKKNQWIQSWEVGVLLHPQCLEADMLIPTYKTDRLQVDNQSTVVPIRLPFDLPLTPYSSSDIIWSPNQVYTRADWRGETWPMF